LKDLKKIGKGDEKKRNSTRGHYFLQGGICHRNTHRKGKGILWRSGTRLEGGNVGGTCQIFKKWTYPLRGCFNLLFFKKETSGDKGTDGDPKVKSASQENTGGGVLQSERANTAQKKKRGKTYRKRVPEGGGLGSSEKRKKRKPSGRLSGFGSENPVHQPCQEKFQKGIKRSSRGFKKKTEKVKKERQENP